MRPIRGLATVAAAILAAGLVPAAPAAAAAAPQWHKTLTAKGRNLAGDATVVSPDGGTVFVTGTGSASDSSFGQTVAYNAATGAKIWSDRFNPNPGKDDSNFSSIAVSPDGSTVFVAGRTGSIGGGSTTGPVIVAYNAVTGAELWQAIGTVGAGVGPSPMVVSPDGATVFVTSNSVGFTGQTSAYAAATGTQLWTEPAGGDAIALDASALYVSGERSGSSDPGSEAFNSLTGATIWQATQSGSNVLIKAAALSPDGSVLYADGTSGPGGSATGFAAAYSASSGAPLWTVSTGKGDIDVTGLAVPASGNAIVSESIGTGIGMSRWVTRALDPAAGATVWNKTRNFTQAATFTTALALSPDGSTVYVTGGAGAPLTIGYSTADGTPVFTASFHGPADSAALASAVSPDGSRFITTGGIGQNPGTNFAMLTVAYPTG